MPLECELPENYGGEAFDDKATLNQWYFISYRNFRVFGDKFVTEFGESLNLVRCSVKISVTILVFHQNR